MLSRRDLFEENPTIPSSTSTLTKLLFVLHDRSHMGCAATDICEPVLGVSIQDIERVFLYQHERHSHHHQHRNDDNFGNFDVDG